MYQYFLDIDLWSLPILLCSCLSGAVCGLQQCVRPEPGMHAGTAGTGGPRGERCGRPGSSAVPGSVWEAKNPDIGGKPCIHLPPSRSITGTGTVTANSILVPVSQLDVYPIQRPQITCKMLITFLNVQFLYLKVPFQSVLLCKYYYHGYPVNITIMDILSWNSFHPCLYSYFPWMYQEFLMSRQHVKPGTLQYVTLIQGFSKKFWPVTQV